MEELVGGMLAWCCGSKFGVAIGLIQKTKIYKHCLLHMLCLELGYITKKQSDWARTSSQFIRHNLNKQKGKG